MLLGLVLNPDPIIQKTCKEAKGVAGNGDAILFGWLRGESLAVLLCSNLKLGHYPLVAPTCNNLRSYSMFSLSHH